MNYMNLMSKLTSRVLAALVLLSTLIITACDDDEKAAPAVVKFAQEGKSVTEDAGLQNVLLSLDPAANNDGTITITYSPASASITTIPAATDGTISIPVSAGSTEVAFTVVPQDNDIDDDDYSVVFTLDGVSDGFRIDTEGTTFTLTVADDDNIQVATIAEIRAMYQGENLNITEDIYVQGVVTSSNANGNLNANNAFVQDATAGIVLRFTSANTLVRGDEVLVNLNGGRLTEFNGLRQVEQLPNQNGIKIGDSTLPQPEVITVTQLLTGEYEGKLVTIENVYFPDADGIMTMAGSKTVSDGTNTTIVRTENGATFSGELLPLGSGSITGVAGDFNGAQISPQVFAEDVFENVPLGTIQTSASELPDFGQINTGEMSESVSYTIQGTGFVENLVITAPPSFLVGKTVDGDYEQSITITAQEANAGVVTVNVKFAPTSGTAEIKTGQIVNKSRGFVSKTIEVAGEEVGATVPKTVLALWTFETSKPNSTGAVSADIAAEEGVQSGNAIAKGVHASDATVYSNPVGNASDESFSVNTWEANDYFEFSVNGTGYSDIHVSWDQTGSGTGPSDFALYYSTDGTNFTKHADYTIVKSTGSNITYDDGTTGGSWNGTKRATNTTHSYDLSSVTALNNASTLVFRLVQTGTGIATGGTNRVDNFKVEGID